MTRITIIAIIAVLASCTSESDSPTPQPDNEQEVSFSVYSARFADVDTRATAGNLGLEDLRQDGFGVFAYSTGQSDYSVGTYAPNFMYDQLVADTTKTGTWTYSPKKFWPADGGKISFFAYAPYQSPTESSDEISLSSNTSTDAPTVNYSLAQGGNNVDLLWGAKNDGSPLTNLTKYNPNIDFYFRHALTKIGGAKQETDTEAGLTINLNADDDALTGGSTVSQGTKVTLSRVLIEQIGTVATSGTLNLMDGSWTVNNISDIDSTSISPYRQLIVVSDSMHALGAQATINPDLAEPTTSQYVADSTSQDGYRLPWDSIPSGITTTAQSVYGIETMPLLVIPDTSFLPVLRLTVCYTIRTSDPWLLRGHSLMRETLSQVFTLSEKPLAAHRYKINIHLGLHSIHLTGNLEEWQVQHGSIIHDKTTQQNLEGPDIHDSDPSDNNKPWLARKKQKR